MPPVSRPQLPPAPPPGSRESRNIELEKLKLEVQKLSQLQQPRDTFEAAPKR